ncbi:MAG: 50S ribosomal protein L24 [Firmicutes bacterium]|nr:50S ribosomal protein L24 [Bacillota bacterium]
MSYRIKKNDNVIVLTGRDKGKTGKVLFVDPASEFVKVENINMVSRHKKAKNAQEQAGIRKMEGNVHISNVMAVCPSCGKPTRLAATLQDGKKLRVCKKCGAGIEVKVEKVKKRGKEREKVEKAPATKSGDSRVKRTRKPKPEEKETADE